MATAPARHSTPVEHGLRDATAIDCSGRCAGRAQSQRRIRMQGTVQCVACGGERLRAIHAMGDLVGMLATLTPRMRDTGILTTGGACHLTLDSWLSARRPRNGPDAHRMTETRNAAWGAA